MIDPIIFTIRLGNLELPVHWYGVLIVAAILVGEWITEKEFERRGGDPDYIWDVLLWVLPAAIIGARLWYVANSILGGNTYYLENPLMIPYTPQGGLHIFGAFTFGALVAYIHARKRGVDIRKLLDSVAPALLLAQAVARPANFINQELYGPPTTLPWGIPIDLAHRLPQYQDLATYPLATTRFHPTFAYEMIWNVLAVSVLLWAARRFKHLKPGSLFAGWLVLAGLGRFIIEWFRPDQPRIAGTEFSYSRLIAAIMFLVGLVWFLRSNGYIGKQTEVGDN